MQGMYPTVVIILVKMQKSLWDTVEMAPTLSHSHMKFVSRPGMNSSRGSRAGTTVTAVASVPDSHHTETGIDMVNLNRSGDLEKVETSSPH